MNLEITLYMPNIAVPLDDKELVWLCEGILLILTFPHLIFCGLQDYIHRVGRTARAGRSGLAISLVNQNEIGWFKQIENLIGGLNIRWGSWKQCVLCTELYTMFQVLGCRIFVLIKRKSCYCWSVSQKPKEFHRRYLKYHYKIYLCYTRCGK